MKILLSPYAAEGATLCLAGVAKQHDASEKRGRGEGGIKIARPWPDFGDILRVQGEQASQHRKEAHGKASMILTGGSHVYADRRPH